MIGSVFLKLLGTPALYIDEEPLSLSRKKSLALLAYLSLEGGTHARDSLASMFWPECAQDKARANLRSCLIDLSEHLQTEVFSKDRDHVALLPGLLLVDALQFRAKTRHCPDHVAETVCDRCATPLMEASKMPADAFMEGFTLQGCVDFDDWQSMQGSVFLEAIVSVRRKLCSWHETRGNLDLATTCARSWICADPFDEEARRKLMQLYALSGRWVAAEDCYREWVSVSRKELGTGPEETTEALHNKIANLRPRSSYGTSLIGREEAETSLRNNLIKSSTRICTITGPGGVGKTRLARSLAEVPGPDFPDGSIFVDISTIRDSALVVSELASSVGVIQRVNTTESLVSRIISALGNKRLLLILDNFEQVLAGAGIIGRIASACKRVSILITSRVRLGIEGEHEFALAPLGSPGEPGSFRIENAEAFPAVRLLVERAISANPAIAIGEADAIYAARVCSRLDGLPLAIELAASRLGTYSLRELDEKIAQTSRVLDSMESARPIRQRSLNAAIEWSWELLDDEEKKSFEILSVFSGGFERVAAESVCGKFRRLGKGRDLLGELVAWNLVTRQETRGHSRFRMPEAIREFAAEHLRVSKDFDAARRVHALFYLQIAQELSPKLHNAEQRECLSLMKQDHGNFLAALDYFEGSSAAQQALELAEALEWYWYRSGRYTEGCMALERALKLGKDSSQPVLFGRALRAKAWLMLLLGDWVGSRDTYSLSVRLLRESGDAGGLSRALSGLGIAERWLGEIDTGIMHGKESLAIARKSGDPLQITFALIWLYSNTGGQKIDDFHLDALNETLFLSRAARDPWCEAHALQGLGDYLRVNDDIEASIACYEESLRLFESIGEDWMLAWTLDGLGMAEFHANRLDSALSWLRKAFDLFLKLGDRGDVAYLIGEIGLVIASAGDVPKGDLLLGASCSLLRDVTYSAGTYAQSRDIPSSLSLYFFEAESRNSMHWKRGLILGFERAVQEAIDLSAPGKSLAMNNAYA